MPTALLRILLLALLCWPPFVVAAATADGQPPATVADTNAPAPADLHIFWREGCAHCEAETAFLARLQATRPGLRIHRHEVIHDRAARALFVATARAMGSAATSVPFTVVGDRYVTGYLDDETTGAAIARMVDECAAVACADRVAEIAAGPEIRQARIAGAKSSLPETLNLPFAGEVRTAHLSLPLLTITLAAIDGFNPCAMWALVFLLGLLVGLKDRRRMWALGIAFVVASAVAYFLFLTAWLNLVLFVGAIGWLQKIIGLVALAGGSWYLYEWKTRRDAQCQVTAAPARRRILDGLRSLAQRQQLALALTGIILLAFAVNLVELVCSAGIPAVYTQILAMTPLSSAAHYGYLALYILVFMLDDLFVLAAALFTLQITGLTGRYTHAATLFGGLVLLALGLLMLFRPQWLTFG